MRRWSCLQGEVAIRSDEQTERTFVRFRTKLVRSGVVNHVARAYLNGLLRNEPNRSELPGSRDWDGDPRVRLLCCETNFPCEGLGAHVVFRDGTPTQFQPFREERRTGI